MENTYSDSTREYSNTHHQQHHQQHQTCRASRIRQCITRIPYRPHTVQRSQARVDTNGHHRENGPPEPTTNHCNITRPYKTHTTRQKFDETQKTGADSRDAHQQSTRILHQRILRQRHSRRPTPRRQHQRQQIPPDHRLQKLHSFPSPTLNGLRSTTTWTRRIPQILRKARSQIHGAPHGQSGTAKAGARRGAQD